MLKRDITYTDFNDKQTTETHYFNLSMGELIELEMSTKEGIREWVKKIIESNDRQAIFAEFKKIILSAYGVKSEDGKSFKKSDQLREDFSNSGAFHQMLFEIATDDNAASQFILGALPKDLSDKVKAVQDKPQGLPPRPPVKSV